MGIICLVVFLLRRAASTGLLKRWGVLVVGAIGIGVVGFLLGRALPYRHYVSLGGPLLIESSTGKVCVAPAFKYTKVDNEKAENAIRQAAEQGAARNLAEAQRETMEALEEAKNWQNMTPEQRKEQQQRELEGETARRILAKRRPESTQQDEDDQIIEEMYSAAERKLRQEGVLTELTSKLVIIGHNYFEDKYPTYPACGKE